MGTGVMLLVNLVISITIILFLILVLKLNPAITLVIAGLYMGISSGLGLVESSVLVSEGFGSMMVGIGLPIGFGIILGQLLSDCGGAHVIARGIVNKFPKNKALFAIGLAGFILSIPVFFDVTFVILMPIGVAISKEINKPMQYVAGVLTIGATTAHCLVPPTPNPLAAADIFKFDLGIMVIAGIIIGSIAAIGAIITYVWIHNKGIWNKEKDENIYAETNDDLELALNEASASLHLNKVPSFFESMIPIMLPVICILLGTVTNAITGNNPPIIVAFLGDKLIALLLGTLAAYIIGAKYMGKANVEKSATNALKSAGMVLLITGAGGAFGSVIKATGIGDVLVSTIGINGTESVIPAIVLAFFIGFIFRVAQGSGTVAGITSMNIMSTVAPMIHVHPVYIAMACLAGGNSVGHVNDSGFWVVTNLSKFSITGGLKTYTLGSFLSAIIIFICAIIGAILLPMV